MTEENGLERLRAVDKSAGSTLLPAHIASAVSLATRSGSLSLRLGTFIGGLALDGARVTTLTGLELSRAFIEGILSRAGRDVTAHSAGELGTAEADRVLVRSISTLHSTITGISFAASSGFHLSSAALSSVGDLSQQLLGTLDSILGSTDSSRAIASIITLIRTEFQNPATGQEGESVTVSDLLIGICGLALLQRWCKKITDKEAKATAYEELVWDMVVMNDGRRADVTGNNALVEAGPVSFVTAGSDNVVQTIEGAAKDDSDDDMLEIALKQRIMRALPPNASVSITTEIETSKTITVEVTGARLPDISPLPGMKILERGVITAADDGLEKCDSSSTCDSRPEGPRHKVVYRFTRNNLQGTNIKTSTLAEPDEEARMGDDRMDSPLRAQASECIVRPRSSIDANIPPLPPTKDVNVSTPRPIQKTRLPVASKPTSNSNNNANQKRTRKPVHASSSTCLLENMPAKKVARENFQANRETEKGSLTSPLAKRETFGTTLKKSSGITLSSLWHKDNDLADLKQRNPGRAGGKARPKDPILSSAPALDSIRDAPHTSHRGSPNYFSSQDLGVSEVIRSPSRVSHYSIHERRRDSIVSQTDSYSIHSGDYHSDSPTTLRRVQTDLAQARAEKSLIDEPPSRIHRRSKSYVPSIYTLRAHNSATSLVLSDECPTSAYGDLNLSIRTGSVGDMFPQKSLVSNITRYVKFASASYGANFLRLMGIAAGTSEKELDTTHHHEHNSFSTHTQLPPSTILLSSFVDPQGGTDSSGHTDTGIPMVHFVSLDHDSKAVVLTCRGTLGFEDVLADLTCDYDDLTYCGITYKVHKGIHASARRLLDGGGRRVLLTIAAALEEFPDYGLVMCGHSLGGGVTALLAVMLSEPDSDSTSRSFVTSSPQLLLTDSGVGTAPICLPPGRPVHVYAYGPPATMSSSLRVATRGLITTVVNREDVVPYLSLGVLHDLQAVALAFKTDDSGAKSKVHKRVWEGIAGTLADKWYNRPAGMSIEDDDQWAFSALKTLRASMLSYKLVPPGEVFTIETTPVLHRNAFVKDDPGLGKPAMRVVFKHVRDVEMRFSEICFGGSMLADHSPRRYEASLAALHNGVPA